MMDMRDRYTYDATFRNLVDTIRIMIENGNFTPTEIREAAMLAQIMYEERHIKPITLDSIDEIRKFK